MVDCLPAAAFARPLTTLGRMELAMPILRIFLAVPMDSIERVFRIERLTSRQKGSIQSVHGRSADGRPREMTTRGARAL